MSAMSGRLLPLVFAAVLTVPAASSFSSTAAAQTPADIFRQGRTMMEQKKYAAACPLFAEAHRLEPKAVGILLNLAECYKQIGKKASAWSAYNEAEFLAKKDSDVERVQFAHAEATALEPTLAKLRIDAKDTPGLVIRRDDENVGKGLWGTAFPIDPGEHKIEATAPGYRVWSTVVKVGVTPELQVVAIPPLSKDVVEPAPSPSAAPAAAQVPFWSGRRVAGVAVGAAGIAGLAVGAAFGGLVAGKVSDSKATCSEDGKYCTEPGLTLRRDANGLANASNAAFAIGGAATLAGIILFATAPSSAPKASGKLTLNPVAGAGMTGLVIDGVW